MSETAAVSAAEREARALAVAIIDRAAPREAGRAEFDNARAAAEIIAAAEIAAGHVDRSTYAAMLAEIAEAAEEAEARILKMAQEGATAAAVEQAVQRSMAESEAKEQAMRLWLDRQAEAAWEEAGRKLRALAGGAVN